MRGLVLATTAAAMMALAGCNFISSGGNEASTPNKLAEAPAKGGAEPAANAAAAGNDGKASEAPAADRSASRADSGGADGGGKGGEGRETAAAEPAPRANRGGQCDDGRDRRVVVVNDTSTVLRELYGSDVRHDTWEEDVLGSNVLGAGESINVNFDDGDCGCNFDLKAVFVDGEEATQRDFNVCRESTWRITGE